MCQFAMPEDVNSYRLKTKRQKTKQKKKAFEKKLIQIKKLDRNLHKKKQNLPWIPLENPYQAGWKRTFVLTKETKDLPNAAFYEGILPLINTVQYCPEKSFVMKQRRNKWKNKRIEKQDLKNFTSCNFHHSRCALSIEQKRFFHPVEKFCYNGKDTYIQYEFTEPWRFELAVFPNIIREKKMHLPDLESEIKLLDNFIERKNLGNKLYRRWRQTDESFQIKKATQFSIRQLLTEMEQDKFLS
jgi:hypothetical protein